MITASIVCYNTSAADLDKVVRSALAEPVDILYLVDHSPADAVERILPSLPADARIRYMRHPNTGFGAGHNVAIRDAMARGSRYHAVLNPDIYWTDPVIAALARYMDENPDVGMTTPKVLYPDGRLQYTCKMIPTPADLLLRRFLPSALTRRHNARFQLEDSGYNRIMNVPYMHGCFMLLSVDAIRRAGGFDERFFMYPEDIDLTRRLHEISRTIFYPDVAIYHVHAAESRKSLRMLWIHIVNMIKYFNKWGWIFDSRRRRYNLILLDSLKNH